MTSAICDSLTSVVFIGTETFPECSLLDVKLHILSSAVFGNEQRLGRKTGLAAPLFDPLPAAKCVLGTAHLNLHIRLHSFPYSHFPWLLNQVAAARQDQRGWKEFACTGTAECSKMPPFPFSDTHPAFKAPGESIVNLGEVKNASWIISWSALTH